MKVDSIDILITIEITSHKWEDLGSKFNLHLSGSGEVLKMPIKLAEWRNTKATITYPAIALVMTDYFFIWSLGKHHTILHLKGKELYLHFQVKSYQEGNIHDGL